MLLWLAALGYWGARFDACGRDVCGDPVALAAVVVWLVGAIVAVLRWLWPLLAHGVSE